MISPVAAQFGVVEIDSFDLALLDPPPGEAHVADPEFLRFPDRFFRRVERQPEPALLGEFNGVGDGRGTVRGERERAAEIPNSGRLWIGAGDFGFRPER